MYLLIYNYVMVKRLVNFCQIIYEWGRFSMNNYIYRYEQFVLKKTLDGSFVVVNSNSKYECHSHVKTVEAGKALCKLAAKRKLPKKKDLYFIESLIRLSNNKKYLAELKQLKEKIINEQKIYYKKENHEDINKIICDGIAEYYNEK